MKKHFRKILSGALGAAMLIAGVNVSAATLSMKTDWHGDYSDGNNPKLVVEVETPAIYTQQIMSVIYGNSITNPTWEDYIRVKEVVVTGGKTELTFEIDDDFNATDNKYKLSVQGNGYQSGASETTQTITVLPKGSVAGLLLRINGASSSTIMSVMDEAADVLQFTAETDSARREKLGLILVSIRTDDYNGTFSTLEDVRRAWNAADLICALTDGLTTAQFKSKLEAGAAKVGINVTTSDYKANADKVCSALIANASSYNNGVGVSTISDLNKIYGQYLGMYVVNGSTTDNIFNNFEKYKSYFDIESSVLTKYNAFGKIQKSAAVAYLFSKNYTSPQTLATDFKWAVNNTNTGSGNNNNGNGNNGGNTGNSGNTGSSIMGGSAGPSAPSTPQTNGYSDVTSSHWAYSYVTLLSNKGVISGYDDNTFRPDDNVTREEFLKMIIVASGLYDPDAECEFTDVPQDAWYYKYVASAYKNGIVSGIKDDTFGVGTNITRQDVAVIAARILGLFGKTDSVSSSTLTDIDSVSDYAQESVKLLNSMGIINGFDDGSFMPHNALTRAEAATIICKLVGSL